MQTQCELIDETVPLRSNIFSIGVSNRHNLEFILLN